jgi:hypothetical protein
VHLEETPVTDDPPPSSSPNEPGTDTSSRELVPLRRSEFAAELAKLPASIKDRYGVVAPTLVILDGIVGLCWLMMDESDARSWIEKFEYVIDKVTEGYDLDDADVQAFLADFAETDVAAYLEVFPKQNFRDFFKRLVGEGTYHRLSAAFTRDSAPVVAVSRLAMKSIAPFVLAWDDLTAELSDEQLKAFKDLAQSRGQMLPMMASVFRLLDSTVVHLDIPESWMSRGSLTTVAEDEIDVLRAELRLLTAGASREAMKELSATLTRKLSGAKDALAHSSDSVSQAANSLIELIDRLLRVFTDEEVLEWLEANYPKLPDTTYEKDGKVRPSTRGRALCVVHGSEKTDNASDMYIVAAMALSRTRKTLQQLKHADENTPEERAQIESCMNEVESFFFLLTSFTWVGVDDSILDMVRNRLDPKRVQVETVATESA